MRFRHLILVLLSHASIGLPITSQPLASNPEHLTWDAWITTDIRHPDQKPKKITPKSIFITPNLFEPAYTCPPDHKLDHHNRCIQIVQINHDDLLAQRLGALLGTAANAAGDLSQQGNGGEYDYDYEEMDEGPFQLSLPLTFDTTKTTKDEDSASSSGQSFRVPANESAEKDETQEDDGGIAELKRDSTSTTVDPPASSTTAERSEQSSSSTPSFLYTRYPTTSTTTEIESSASPTVIPASASSTDLVPSSSSESPTEYASASSSSSLSSTEPFSTESSSAEPSDTEASSTEYSTTESSSTELSSTELVEPFGSAASPTSGNNESPVSPDESSLSSSTESDAGAVFSSSLPNDLDSYSSSTATVGHLTPPPPPHSSVAEETKIHENIIPDTVNQTGLLLLEEAIDMTNNTGEMEFFNEDGEPESFEDLISDMENESIQYENVGPSSTVTRSTTPAPPPVFIVTPEPPQIKWQPSIITTPTRYHKKKDVADRFEIHVPDELSVIKHEQVQDYLDNIDSNNRFIYHHMSGSSSSSSSSTTTTAAPPTTTTTTTPRPTSRTTTTSYDVISQLREINRIVNEQRLQLYRPESNRIRFPPDSPPPPPPSSYHTNRFTWSASGSPVQTSTITTTTPTPTTKTTPKPLWWLPNTSDWDMNESGQKPLLLRFWQRMPLVQDPSHAQSPTSTYPVVRDAASALFNSNRGTVVGRDRSGSRSQSRRENSRSPSENLYKEISSQDIYKVLQQNSNRDWKHTNS